MDVEKPGRVLTVVAAVVAGMLSASAARALPIGPVELGSALNLGIALYGIDRLEVGSDSAITGDGGFGNAGAGPDADPFKFSGSAQVVGTVFHAPGNPPRITGSADVLAEDDTQNMAQVVTELQTAAVDAAMLTATQTYSDVSEVPEDAGVPTIAGGSPVNVIDIDSIDLSSTDRLVLTAGPGEVMILNVETLDLSASSQILLEGDLGVDEVLFNIADSFSTSSLASLSGGFLCVMCTGVQVHDGGVLRGFLYANAVAVGSGASVVWEPRFPAIVLPPISEPAVPALISLPAVFLGAGLIALGARRRGAA